MSLVLIVNSTTKFESDAVAATATSSHWWAILQSWGRAHAHKITMEFTTFSVRLLLKVPHVGGHLLFRPTGFDLSIGETRFMDYHLSLAALPTDVLSSKPRILWLLDSPTHYNPQQHKVPPERTWSVLLSLLKRASLCVSSETTSSSHNHRQLVRAGVLVEFRIVPSSSQHHPLPPWRPRDDSNTSNSNMSTSDHGATIGPPQLVSFVIPRTDFPERGTTTAAATSFPRESRLE